MGILSQTAHFLKLFCLHFLPSVCLRAHAAAENSGNVVITIGMIKIKMCDHTVVGINCLF